MADRPLLEVATVEGPGCTMVEVVGEVDLSTVGHLVEGLEIGANRGGDLVVDLSRLSFIDASGLRALVMAHSDMRARGSRLVVSGPPPFVVRLLEVTGLTDVFDLLPVTHEPLVSSRGGGAGA